VTLALITVAFGSIHGGTSGNVIPARIELEGTARTLDPSLWEVLPGLMDKAIASIVLGSGATYTLDYDQAIRPVVNDGAVVETAVAGISDALGERALEPTSPSMGGEDFSSYLTEVPGALFRLGTSGAGHDLHSPGFTLDEGTIGVGIRAGTGAILSMLDRL
jgi:amidohydrolase